MATYLFYNPLAGGGAGTDGAKALSVFLPESCQYYDMTKITNYAAVLSSIEPEDTMVIAGGDGTLNRFVNDTDGLSLPSNVLYFPVGTGNDFARDLGKEDAQMPFPVVLQNLPTVQVKGKTYRFLNGVGFGIDGYCCQVGDARRAAGKSVNYTSIAISGLLRHFEPRSAQVTVDGTCMRFDKVWIAPTMFGRYYGGGMMAAPMQDRAAPEGKLTLMLFHGAGRLRTLCAFPGIFKGTHVRHTDMVTVLTGREIRVEFDRPTPLQIDGETILDVTCYTAKAAIAAIAAR